MSKIPTPAQIRRKLKESEEAAAELCEVGMAVIVTDDLGKEHESKLLTLPWKLYHGQWVAHCEGFSSYMTNRIRPL